MKILRLLLLAVLNIVLFSCHEDFMGISKVEENIPVKVRVNITVPSSQEVTRAIQYEEYKLDSLVLVMFSKTSNRKELVTIHLSEMAGGDPNIGLATYVSEETEMLTGEYELFVLSNIDSPFSSVSSLNLDDITKEELIGLSTTLKQTNSLMTKLAESEKLLMVEYKSSFVITEDSENLLLSLTRVSSKIEFSFKTAAGINFTPISYSVYNLPVRSRVFNDNNNDYLLSSDDYSNFTDILIPSGNSGFQFFMFENLKHSTSCSTYHDRDKWNIDGDKTDEGKEFINAPENSTYVVVKGTYNDNEYTGTLSYTIHLGDLRNSTFNNFAVKRNQRHINEITINGVSSIIHECTVYDDSDNSNGGKQPGAEGDIVKKSNNFILDAHYETLMLELDITDFISSQNILIHTPFTEEIIKMDDSFVDAGKFDIDWVQFICPKSASTMRNYTADKSELFNIFDLINELKLIANNDTYVSDKVYKSKNKLYVQAFVDEYFYETNPITKSPVSWTKFVNNSLNRTISVSNNINYSQDGNSTYSASEVFSISQRSIKTVYSLDNDDINAFGIETWNETGINSFTETNQVLSFDDGWSNTIALLPMKSSWKEYDNYEKKGYFKASQSSDSHYYSSNPVNDGRYACLSRNRDENGNGIIDEDEIKWYLPALNQFFTLWIGEGQLQEETRLFDPGKVTSLTSSDHDNLHHYFTSSNKSERVYWAVEGSSYSPNSLLFTGLSKTEHRVRCIRNLKTYRGVTQSVSKIENDIISLNYIDGQIRDNYQTTPYAYGHNERSSDNKLYSKFEVAKSNLSNNTYHFEDLKKRNLCDGYKNDNETSSVGWRVPNQRELMLMVRHKDGISNLVDYTTSSTFFSNSYKNRPFSYNGTLIYLGLGVPKIPYEFPTSLTSYYHIRCVRDVNPY